MTTDPGDLEFMQRRKQEQLLKLVTKGFYTELINYGVPKADIVKIATHLLGHVSEEQEQTQQQDRFYSRIFDLAAIDDRWASDARLSVGGTVVLRPLDDALVPEIHGWLSEGSVRESFVTPYPTSVEGLAAHFEGPACRYFAIEYEGKAVGLIGAENMDERSRRLEMRKLVGNRALQGMGIGKRATFAFLYYVFRILDFEKVYIHSMDVNVRNLNLNSQFGFTLEGVLMQELVGPNGRIDVLRMGLMRERWAEIFT